MRQLTPTNITYFLLANTFMLSVTTTCSTLSVLLITYILLISLELSPLYREGDSSGRAPGLGCLILSFLMFEQYMFAQSTGVFGSIVTVRAHLFLISMKSFFVLIQ